MQIYADIVTLLTVHVLHSLLAQKWPPMVSQNAVYAELRLC